MNIFIYNPNESHAANFWLWYDFNSAEKEAFGEERYTLHDGSRAFNDIYRDKKPDIKTKKIVQLEFDFEEAFKNV